MDSDFARYEELKRKGKTAEEACMQAMSDKRDLNYRHRMLLSVYGLDFDTAHEVQSRAHAGLREADRSEPR